MQNISTFLYLLIIVIFSNIIPAVNASLSQDVKESARCAYCLADLDDFISATRSGYNNATLKNILWYYCPLIDLKNEKVCHDMVKQYFPSIKYIVANQPNVTSELVCRLLFQGTGECDYKNPYDNWNIKIHPPVNADHANNTNVVNQNNTNNIIQAKSYIPKGGASDLKILQITDFHYDPAYKVGASVNCKQPVCCREINHTEPVENRAGKWGNYERCDTPLSTIENAISQIKAEHKGIDLIYITGDYVDHASWKSSWPHNFLSISTVFDKLEAAFPTIPKYPILGNHEPNPFNFYAPSYIEDQQISTKPLYDFVINKWTWLPKSAKKTILDGGYYTVKIRPGLRLIALNNNVCLVSNWWLLFDTTAVAKPLQWLQNTLFQAEKHGEMVHILSHVPTGYANCDRKWAQQYNVIIERYYKIISAQFNGHSHRDQFNLHFAQDHPFTPINVVWNGGSIDPWTKVNPNYKIYFAEAKTFQITNIETWIFNLTEANLSGNHPRWFLEYRFRETYDVPNLSPASMYNLTERFAQDYSLLYKYWRFFVKQGDPFLKEGCSNDCMAAQLCQIVTTEFNFNGNERCKYLANIFLSKFSGIE